MSAFATASVDDSAAMPAPASLSLPGIVDCHAHGLDTIQGYPDEPPAGLEDALPGFPKDGVGGRTVGPVLLPQNGQIPWLIERLKNYVRESVELGWMEDEAMARKYQQVLDRVELVLSSQLTRMAREMLAAFRRQVESDFHQGRLTTESYALLVYNGRFLGQLLSQLKD